MPDEDKEDRSVHLELKDNIAIVIASLQTTLLPFLIVIVVLLALWLVFSHLP
jgi:hypothetical protein